MSNVLPSFLPFPFLTIPPPAAVISKTVSYDNTDVELIIWDTAGQERYHSLAPMYYRGAHAAVVVYDITDQVHVIFWVPWL